jgi:hypothetical protein
VAKRGGLSQAFGAALRRPDFRGPR